MLGHRPRAPPPGSSGWMSTGTCSTAGRCGSSAVSWTLPSPPSSRFRCSAPTTSPLLLSSPIFARCIRPSRPPMRPCPLGQTSRLGPRMHARAGAWAQPPRAAVSLRPHRVQLLSDPHHAHRQPAVVCGRGCGMGGGGGYGEGESASLCAQCSAELPRCSLCLNRLGKSVLLL